MKKVEEHTSLDLLELTLQLHSRAINQPGNKEMHEASMEARQELEKRLQINKNDFIPDVVNSKIIKVQATSFTTGSKKWFIISEDDYNKRLIIYPAWNFNENTKTTNIHET